MKNFKYLLLAGTIALLAVLSACNQAGKTDDAATAANPAQLPATASAEGTPPANPAEDPPAAPVIVNPVLVYQNANCKMCHGENREGTKLGPALTGLEAHWTEEALMEYLRDPGAYAAKDERLTKQAEAFPSMMPRVQVDDEVLKALAAWLIAGY